MSTPALQVSGLEVSYGPIVSVRGIDLDVAEGKVTTLVGANGAGKTSTLLALSGLVKKKSGRVVLAGEDISSKSPHSIVKSGMVQVAEGRATLTTLSVYENLMLGAYTCRDKRQIAGSLDRIFNLFPRLKERSSGLAGNLSGGEQQMLAMGRALMAKPKVLLLDEPSMGLAPIMIREIFKSIVAINREGTTILLIEQNVKQALRIAHKAYVMETGAIVLSGTGRDLLDDPKVQSAYLGI